MTSNPTIFAKAVADADDYDEQVKDLAVRGVDLEEAVRAITTYDVRWACDVLRDVYDRTDGKDGRVSIEVDPRLAHRTDATIAEARALWWLVDRPNVMIKIPATEEGLAAITAATAEGISVNVTLIFSLQRYRAVMDAYLTGLEQAHSKGVDLSSIRSVASFFVSRIDTEVDKRLDALSDANGGSEEAKALRSKAAVANARLAYQQFEKVFTGERWTRCTTRAPTRSGRCGPRRRVKDPDLPDTMYVEELVAPDTVNTMPEATIEATADHGEITGDSVRPNYDDAQQVLDRPRDDSASPTTTWSRWSRTRASTSSRSRGRSCSTPSSGALARDARMKLEPRRPDIRVVRRRGGRPWSPTGSPAGSPPRTPRSGVRTPSRGRRSGCPGCHCRPAPGRCSPRSTPCAPICGRRGSTGSCSAAWAARRWPPR